jgi:hypothetical protein
MSRPAAGRNAGRDWNHTTLRGVLGKRVEIGRVGGFERGEIALFLGGQIAKTVEHKQDEFGVGLESQFRIKSVKIHGSISVQKSRHGQVATTRKLHDANKPVPVQCGFVHRVDVAALRRLELNI